MCVYNLNGKWGYVTSNDFSNKWPTWSMIPKCCMLDLVLIISGLQYY